MRGEITLHLCNKIEVKQINETCETALTKQCKAPTDKSRSSANIHTGSLNNYACLVVVFSPHNVG